MSAVRLKLNQYLADVFVDVQSILCEARVKLAKLASALLSAEYEGES
jgi:hypothetical protein